MNLVISLLLSISRTPIASFFPVWLSSKPSRPSSSLFFWSHLQAFVFRTKLNEYEVKTKLIVNIFNQLHRLTKLNVIYKHVITVRTPVSGDFSPCLRCRFQLHVKTRRQKKRVICWSALTVKVRLFAEGWRLA